MKQNTNQSDLEMNFLESLATLEEIECVSKLSPRDRQGLINYWSKIEGDEYAKLETEDYGVTAGSENSTDELKEALASLSEKDAKEVEKYWADLLPESFAKAQVEDYTPTGKVVGAAIDKEAGIKDTKDFIRNYYAPVHGSSYSSLMVEKYNSKSKGSKS